jgi:hypothetical protein
MKTAADIFIENFVDENGCSEIVFIENLVEKYGEQFYSNNGCQWARKGSKLDKNYVLKRYNAKEMNISSVPWNRVVAIQTLGLKEKIENHSIPQSVRKALSEKPCAVLGVITSDMEIDHKNGMYDTQTYELNDFQRMTKGVNDAKREHCKRCRNSCRRFKASLLGYAFDFVEGDEYSSTCIGCYWNDPQYFNYQISKHFIKGDK